MKYGFNDASQSVPSIVLSPIQCHHLSNKLRKPPSSPGVTGVLASSSCTLESFLPRWMMMMVLLENHCPALVPTEGGEPNSLLVVNPQAASLGTVPQPKGSKPPLFCDLTLPPSPPPPPPKKRGKSISINVECNIIKCQLLRSCALKIIFDSFWST